MLTEQERKELLEFVELFNKTEEGNAKIVYVDESCWSNALTKRKETVKDLFFYGKIDNSYRPYCLMEIEYNDKTYKIHEFLNHVNMDPETNFIDIKMGGDYVRAKVQEFCNPVNQHKLCTVDGVDKILKGQLLGQNQNSRYQTVNSVVNDGYDAPIRTECGHLLKKKSPVVELLTRKSARYLLARGNREDYKMIKRFEEGKIAVKYKNLECYDFIDELSLEHVQEHLSTYYPIITRDQITDILDNIPKEEVDMTVIGLGSAGTGLLDQIARSTYFEKYFLVDFDEVETKNLRNQWYTHGDVGYNKTNSSRNKMYEIKRTYPITYTGKFQDAHLEDLKSKYVVSGFDNLECRMELLNKCLKDFESKYLIDIRYLDYSSSIYFVDLQDEKQVKYYRNLLQADIDGFKEATKYIETKDEFINWFNSKGYFSSNCLEVFDKIFKCPRKCMTDEGGYCTCGYENCKNYLYEHYLKCENKIPVEEEESSCIRENFIDIYKFSSSFVFAAIREIESGNDKPFTHIEAQTEVIPTSVVIRR